MSVDFLAGLLTNSLGETNKVVMSLHGYYDFPESDVSLPPPCAYCDGPDASVCRCWARDLASENLTEAINRIVMSIRFVHEGLFFLALDSDRDAEENVREGLRLMGRES